MASGFAIAADINESYSAMSLPEAIADARAKMEKAAAELDFIAAAKYRNHMYSLQEKLRVEQEVSGKNENSEGMNGSCHNAYTLRREVALIRAKEEVNGAVGGRRMRQPFGRRG